MRKIHWLFPAVLTVVNGCGSGALAPQGDPATVYPGENHFSKLTQLTHGGVNTLPSWSFDGKWILFKHKGQTLTAHGKSRAGQVTNVAKANEDRCDQIYAIKTDGGQILPVSNGHGRNTSASFTPDDSRILFSSTVAAGEGCPAALNDSDNVSEDPVEVPRFQEGSFYQSYQIYSAKMEPHKSKEASTLAQDIFTLEPGAPTAYHADAKLCRDGSIVFTSDQNGDFDLYVGKLQKMGTLTGARQITHELGYDGGAVFSPDCKQIAWVASRPRHGKEEKAYRIALSHHKLRAAKLEIWIADADGSNARQLTRLGSISFGPAFTPDGKQVVFSSNFKSPQSKPSPKGEDYNLYLLRVDGNELEQITRSSGFNGFPAFSADGRRFAFSSDRDGAGPLETNLFVTDWKMDTAPSGEPANHE